MCPGALNLNVLIDQVAGVWNAKDELPIEIDLPESMRFHSVFACPILRQQVILIIAPESYSNPVPGIIYVLILVLKLVNAKYSAIL